MKTIDARGKLCPVPLIMAKKGLNEIAGDESLLILIDNETSHKNVLRFLEEHGMKVHTLRKGEVFEMTVSKTGNIPEETSAADWCAIPEQSSDSYAIAFQRDKLGEGDETLGKMLIWSFIQSLPENSVKPAVMVFLNSGIFLALTDSPALESLQKLEKSGVELLCCGTCLDFYNKTGELAVGKISNMHEILEKLSHAGSVLYP